MVNGQRRRFDSGKGLGSYMLVEKLRSIRTAMISRERKYLKPDRLTALMVWAITTVIRGVETGIGRTTMERSYGGAFGNTG